MSKEVGEYIKIQPFEIMQYFYKTAQLPRIRCYIKFEDHIDEDILKKAVNLSIGAVPLISCVFDEEALSWKKCDFTAADIVHVIDDAETLYDDADLLIKDLDSTREPQVKIILLRQEACDKLFVVINHMISDGCGFKEYLYLLANLYTQCENDSYKSLNKKALRKRNFAQISHNFSIKSRWRILSTKTELEMPPDSFRFPLNGDPDNPVAIIRNIEKEHFDKIKKYAKSNDTSINNIIITAYLREIYRIMKTPDVMMSCPVDLRKYKKKGQVCGICNLTGLYNCAINISEGETFKETLDKVTPQMQAQKASTNCIKMPLILDMMYRLLPFSMIKEMLCKRRLTPFISYTNLGIIDEKRLCFGSHIIEKAFIPTAIKNNPYFQLSVSTFKGCCTLSSCLFASEEDVTFATGILNNVKSEMENLLK